MSFILDALQKSETERHGKSAPSLADVPIRTRRTERPWWIFAVAGLLLVNLAVLAVVLLRSPDPAEATAAAATSMAATEPQRRRVRVLRDTSEAGREFAAAAGAFPSDDSSDLGDPFQENFDPAADPEQMRAAAAVPQGPPIVQPTARSREFARPAPNVNAAPPPAAAAAPPPVAPATPMVPTIDEVMARGTVLPDLRIDLHVYAPTPASRFVFINKQKYVEGQTLREGLVVVQITPDGVELDNGNTRFLLPRR